jgi:hypothetical protein
VHGVQVRVDQLDQLAQGLGLHVDHGLEAVVQAGAGSGAEGGVLQQGRYVQGQQAQTVRGVERTRAVAHVERQLVTGENVYGNVDEGFSGVRKTRLHRAVDRHLGQQTDDALLVGRVDHVREGGADGEAQSVHPYPPLPFARGVQQGCLETDGLHVRQALFYRDLHPEPGVGTDVRQRQQIGRPHEEVPVESVNGQAAGAPDPHHRLESDLPSEVPPEAPFEPLVLQHPRRLEQREVMDAAPAEPTDPRDRGHVDVLRVQDEQVHRDLLSAALQSQPLVEVVGGVQVGHFRSRPLTGVLPGGEGAGAGVGQPRLERGDATAGRRHHLVGGLQRRPQRRVVVVAIVEAGGELGEEVGQQVDAVLQVDEEVVGTGEEDVVDFQDRHLVRLAEALAQREEMEGRVVGDDSDLGARVPRKILQFFEEDGAGALQVAALDGQAGDVEEEEIDGGLRGPQHVLRRGDVLDGARLDLGAARGVPVRLAHRVELEFFGELVDAIAKIAFPPFGVDEEHERVDVGATGATSHDHVALDDGQMGQVFERVDQDPQRQARLLQQRVTLRDLRHGATKHVGTAIGRVQHLVSQIHPRCLHLLPGQHVGVLQQIEMLVPPQFVEPSVGHALVLLVELLRRLLGEVQIRLRSGHAWGLRVKMHLLRLQIWGLRLVWGLRTEIRRLRGIQIWRVRIEIRLVRGLRIKVRLVWGLRIEIRLVWGLRVEIDLLRGEIHLIRMLTKVLLVVQIRRLGLLGVAIRMQIRLELGRSVDSRRRVVSVARLRGRVVVLREGLAVIDSLTCGGLERRGWSRSDLIVWRNRSELRPPLTDNSLLRERATITLRLLRSEHLISRTGFSFCRTDR